MKAKDYLKNIQTINAGILADMEELEELTALATKTTATFGDERVQASGNQQKLEKYAVEIADLKTKIKQDIVECMRMKKVARKLIRDNCEPDCVTLLYKRYFQKKKWEEIAVDMNYTYKWVSGGLHGKALAQLQNALDREKVAN